MSENKINFGELRNGDPFELEFSNIINPVTNVAYTDLTGVNMHFSIKEKLDDIDGDAKATVKDGDSGFSTAAGVLSLRLVSNAVSTGLTPGKMYFFDGKHKDSNGVWRSFILGTNAEGKNVYVGYIWVTPSVTQTPAD